MEREPTFMINWWDEVGRERRPIESIFFVVKTRGPGWSAREPACFLPLCSRTLHGNLRDGNHQGWIEIHGSAKSE